MTRETPKITRREALGMAATAAVSTMIGCDRVIVSTPPKGTTMTQTKPSMPAVFLPHGGGPWPFLDDAAFGGRNAYREMASYMERLGMTPPERPEAILVVSAHWEEAVPTVMTHPKPPMFYDYYGFPPAAYEVEWPAPGAPEMAGRVRELLEAAGFASAANAERGFDHGVFVPLILAYPDADVPTFQLSLKRGLDPAEHLRMGRALAPLRKEGVFLVGSGMSYHNMTAFMQHMRGKATSIVDDSRAFDEWLAETLSLEPSRRETRLVEWEKAPAARASHPREEHLLPLMVIAGAAEDEPSSLPYRDVVIGAHVSAAHFG